MNNENPDDAPIKAFKARMDAVIDTLKVDLKDWIHRHNGDDAFDQSTTDKSSSHKATEVTFTLLDTAIDRQINLLGEKDAREAVISAFERRAKAMRQGLH